MAADTKGPLAEVAIVTGAATRIADVAGALDEQYGGGTAVGRTEDVLEARHARARVETAVRELERRDVLGDKDTDSAR